jgi:hypothetical protein
MELTVDPLSVRLTDELNTVNGVPTQPPDHQVTVSINRVYLQTQPLKSNEPVTFSPGHPRPRRVVGNGLAGIAEVQATTLLTEVEKGPPKPRGRRCRDTAHDPHASGFDPTSIYRGRELWHRRAA